MGPLTAVFCALATCFLAQARTVQNDWLFPSGSDFFDTIPIGLAINISWDSNLHTWFATYAPAATVMNVNLWITDFNDHIFSHQIASDVDVSGAGTFPLTLEVPSSELAVTNEWVFRFIANNETFEDNTGQISSPGFYISTIASSVNTTSSSTPTSTPAKTTTSTPTTTAASTTSAQNGAETTGTSASPSATAAASSSLSTGAKAAITVGAVAGAFILVGAGWFLARRRQKQNPNAAKDNPQHSPGYDGTAPPREKKHSSYNGPEIPSYRAELDPGSPGQAYQQHFAEMDGQNRAPGPR